MATISAADAEIGEVIADAMSLVLVATSFTNWAQFDKGYLSPHFITHP